MKKYIFLLAGISIFAFGISAAHAQVAKFTVGDRVQTGAVLLNVRSLPSASGTILGTQWPGSFGTILGGPTDASGYRWWNVNYDNAPDGWSIENYLAKVSTSASSNCGDVNKDGQPNVFDLNIIIGVAFNGATSTYVTDVNGDGVTDVFDVNAEINYLFNSGPEPTGCSIYTNQPPVNLSISGPGVLTTSTYNMWYFRASDPEGGSLVYGINWGDGNTTSSGALPSGFTLSSGHTYAANGTYTIAFTATDQAGLSTSLTKQVVVSVTASNQPPTIPSGVQGFTGPTGLNIGQSGTWYAKGIDPEGGLLAYRLDWGDGASSTQSSVPSGAQIQFNHSYSQAGTYLVTFRVTDNGGLYAERQLSVSIFVPNQSPVFNSFTGPNLLVVGSLGTWTAQATDPNGDVLSYGFGWGDGTNTYGITGASGSYVTATHSYSVAGTYNVTSTVSDSKGGWAFAGPIQVAVVNPTSTSPIAPKIYPTKTLAPVLNQAYPSAPYSAAALESIRLQISNISEQLKMILQQLGQ